MKRIRRNLFQGMCSVLSLLFFVAPSAQAQGGNFPVRGVVKDSKGELLIGVSVKLKGTVIGVSTDVKGAYTISLPDPNGTLVFSFVGFETKEVAVNNQRTVDITMTEAQNSLEEVVVVGYGTQQKATLSGAISTVTTDDLVRSSAATTASALVGKVQGVTARAADARPGRGSNIQIRNLGNPLYVIDGVPYGGNSANTSFGYSDNAGGQDVFNFISLEDIESITILKDASASIYGLRAANGVVLVTTKKGVRGDNKSQINISSYYGMQNYTAYPKPANAYQFIRAQLQASQNAGASLGTLNNIATAEQLAKWQAGTEKGFQSTDYFDVVMRPNVPQTFVEVNARGGSQKASYFFSASRLDQQALIKDFHYDRTTFRANIDANVAAGLKVGMNISGYLDQNHSVGVPGLDDYFNPFLSVLSMWPTERMYANDNPQYINQTHNVNVNPATYKDDITGFTDEDRRNAIIQTTAEYQFKFGLNLKGTFSYNYTNEDFSCFEYTWKAYIYKPALDVYDDGTLNGGSLYGNQNPFRERHKRNDIKRFGQLQASYKKTFGSHSISGVAAIERSDANNYYMAVHTVPPNNYIPLQAFANQDFLADTWSGEAREAVVGKFNYDYKSRYLVEALGRYDGSYLYAPGKKYGFFPGVSLGWRITEEPFMKERLTFLNDFKLRASYGTQGVETGVNAFGYLTGNSFNSGSAVLNGGYVIGIAPRGLPVTQLSWAVSRSKNIGFDFSMLNNKLSGTFDAFERKRTGLPAGRYDVTVPNETGTSLANENLESDAHRGIEGILTYRSTVGKVNYSVSGNATLSRLRILGRYKPRYGNSYDQWRNQAADRWANVNFGYEVIGRFESQADIDAYPINNDGQGNKTALPGDFKFRDANGDGIISSLDQRPIGYQENANPYMMFGGNVTAGYKGFQLAVDLAGATMQSFQRSVETKIPFQNNGNSAAYMFEDAWHQADPYNPSSPWVAGTYPAVRNGATSNINYQLKSNFWVTNVSYLRIRNVELSYRLPSTLTRKFGAQNMRVYANGSNLFTFSNMNQFQLDPEVNSGGALVYPTQKLINFGFNLTF